MKPQSPSSAVNRWVAAVRTPSTDRPRKSGAVIYPRKKDLTEGSFGFHMTRANWTQAYHSGWGLSSWACSRYNDAQSVLFPKGNSRTLL